MEDWWKKIQASKSRAPRTVRAANSPWRAALPGGAPAGLVEQARVLDSFYVPSRYPNGHAEGAPCEHYGPLQSEAAIAYAGEILAFVRAQMA